MFGPLLGGLFGMVVDAMTLGIGRQSSPGVKVLAIAMFLICAMFGATLSWVWNLRKDQKRLHLVRDFAIRFVDESSCKTVLNKSLEGRALAVKTAVDRSISFQRGGLVAVGEDDSPLSEDVRELRFQAVGVIIKKNVDVEKNFFWRAYNLAKAGSLELFGHDLTRLPQSYKTYLTLETGKPGEGEVKPLSDNNLPL